MALLLSIINLLYAYVYSSHVYKQQHMINNSSNINYTENHGFKGPCVYDAAASIITFFTFRRLFQIL